MAGMEGTPECNPEQRGHDAHGMPPDKAHSGPARFPGCVHRFSCRLCALIDRCLCLLLILPLLPLPTPEPDPDVFTQLRVLLSSPLELVICRRFAVTARRPIRAGRVRMRCLVNRTAFLPTASPTNSVRCAPSTPTFSCST